MKRVPLLLTCALLPFTCFAQDNLQRFIGVMPHPVCGMNPAFDDQARNVPIHPFSACRTLAVGFSADASYPDPGVDALAKLIAGIAETAGWEKKFGPLSQMQLDCRPKMPLGLDPMPGSPGAQLPVCTVSYVQAFFSRYNSQPVVQGFKQMEGILRRLDLKQQSSVAKLKRAESVVRATGGQATFAEIAEVLQ